MSVQNSDNALAERTYTYQSVNEITEDPSETPTEIPTDGPTDAPTQKPTVTPGGSLNGTNPRVINSDGEVTVIDATLIQQCVAQIISTSDINFNNADVNADTTISVVDATLIQRFVAKLENW